MLFRSSSGLSSLNEFLPNLRIAVARGLSASDALAALTTTPAALLGLENTHGTIEEGRVANLVVSEGDLFTEEATVRDVWVHGRAYEVTRPPEIDPRGTWLITSDDEWGFEAELRLEGPLNRLRGSIDVAGPDGASIDLASAEVVAETGRIEVRFDGEDLGYEGVALLAGSVRGEEFYGWTSLPNGAHPSFRGSRTEALEGAPPGPAAMPLPRLPLPRLPPASPWFPGRVPPPGSLRLALAPSAHSRSVCFPSAFFYFACASPSLVFSFSLCAGTFVMEY